MKIEIGYSPKTIKIDRTTTLIKISDLVKMGDLSYTHVYCQTMTGHETAKHTLAPPPALTDLAAKYPDAVVIEYGDGALGIEDGGDLLRAEDPVGERVQACAGMRSDSWQYLNLSLGRNVDGIRLGDTSAD